MKNINELKKLTSVQIAEKTNYLNKDITYLKNIPITEYDIKSAGFSVIKFKKLMSENEIEKIEKMEKNERNVYIGKRIIKEPKINEEILNTLEKVRKAFVLVNRIEGEEILSIKKDAIFIIKKQPTELKIKDTFLFRKKGNYSSYVNLNRKEFFYSSEKNELNIKGVSEENYELQKDFFIKDIRSILRSSEKLNQEELYNFLKKYRSKYLNRELPIETYRNLDTGKYLYEGFELDVLGPDGLEDVDISQNYINYLLPLFKALL